jgi:hypothetical protein
MHHDAEARNLFASVCWNFKGFRFWQWLVILGLMKIQEFLVIFLFAGFPGAWAQSLPEFDFTQPGSAQGWGAAHDISQLQPGAEGLVITISGADPYFSGPARDYPANQLLYARLRLKAEQAGTCQIFYFTSGPSEAASAKFSVPAGRWVEGRVPLPVLGAGYRMRIDPPGTGGVVTIASLRFEARNWPDFDFTTIPDATEWGSPHDLQIQTPGLDGLPLQITGGDPYFFGPARNYPAGQLLWLNLRVKSESTGMAQIFYFTSGPSEEKSVRFYVPGGDWAQLRIPFPALGSGTRLRFDPPGVSGKCILGRMSFELRPTLQEPEWPVPPVPQIAADAVTIVSDDLMLKHDRGAFGAFEIFVKGKLMGAGNTKMMIGYASGQNVNWIKAVATPEVGALGDDSLLVTTTATDGDGGHWIFSHKFNLSKTAGGIEVESSVSVDQARRLVFVPMFTMLPGLGSFGTNKTQGVFAGLEYLENEPSSSEADVIGPGAIRRVPDPLKITFPLMALSTEDRYIGLIWEPSPWFSALHDSPDRTFKAPAHLMSIIAPGAAPELREDGSLLPYDGQLLAANQKLVLHATILGGLGNTVVPAMQQFVARKGLPPQPQTGYTPADYFSLAAHGWLDSQIRDGSKFRHAVGASFGSAPAADAAMFMDWLASKVSDQALSSRLSTTATAAISLVGIASYNSAGVGHIRHPAEALVYGHVGENATTALNEGTGELGLFRPDGSIVYQPPASGTDLSRTHWSREANGLAATHVAAVLERAAFTGDPNLVREGLRLLRALDKFRDTVPRGAQTWEVPLHTPDILASAYLVRAYTRGYELTGDNNFLEQARYWAWTGVPFIYLSPPTDKPVGVYSTIPVFGATQFTAPLWIGLPVQWCGLVYGDAIRGFARHDPSGPWIALANGIARAGLQHTHPSSEPNYQGLLPDSFELRSQARNPVPINPATLLPEAIQMEGEAPVYNFRSFIHHGLFVHAPGPITDIEEDGNHVTFRVAGWPKSPWYVLVSGFAHRPSLKLDGVDVPLQFPHQFQDPQGRLILKLTQPTKVDLLLPAKDKLQLKKQSGANLQLSWPIEAKDYSLEEADPGVLPPNLLWKPSQIAASIQGVEKAATFNPAGPGKLFRLSAQ